MRKRKKGRKLNREIGQRKALLKSLAGNLVLHGKIKTTEAKAKEVSVYVEHLITTAKKKGLSSRRKISQVFPYKISKKMVEEIAPLYQTRKGGYTRIIKLGQRVSDGARMAFIELVK
ncbi:MAG: 50S ribosomal protein L17 [Candidatus Nealsonbacteria bacterium]|nr:50S ribosomal protein L17 [Candidatus Nealsonbacteria bacterium]